MRTRTRWSRLLGLSLALGVVVTSACGGGDEKLRCDENGQNCEICDAYGCHPADPQPGPCDPTLTTCPCQSSTQCDPGTECVDGLCIDACKFDFECGAGKACVNGACTKTCASGGCDAGYVCDKGVCIPDAAHPECDDANPCPSGEVCSGGLCGASCSTNADCADGEVCDAAAGACIPDPSAVPACGGTVTCTGQQVCIDSYCRYGCGTLDDCKKVDSRFFACLDGICKFKEEVDPECTAKSDCADGKDCISNHCL